MSCLLALGHRRRRRRLQKRSNQAIIGSFNQSPLFCELRLRLTASGFRQDDVPSCDGQAQAAGDSSIIPRHCTHPEPNLSSPRTCARVCCLRNSHTHCGRKKSAPRDPRGCPIRMSLNARIAASNFHYLFESTTAGWNRAAGPRPPRMHAPMTALQLNCPWPDAGQDVRQSVLHLLRRRQVAHSQAGTFEMRARFELHAAHSRAFRSTSSPSACASSARSCAGKQRLLWPRSMQTMLPLCR